MEKPGTGDAAAAQALNNVVMACCMSLVASGDRQAASGLIDMLESMNDQTLGEGPYLDQLKTTVNVFRALMENMP